MDQFQHACIFKRSGSRFCKHQKAQFGAGILDTRNTDMGAIYPALHSFPCFVCVCVCVSQFYAMGVLSSYYNYNRDVWRLRPADSKFTNLAKQSVGSHLIGLKSPKPPVYP